MPLIYWMFVMKPALPSIMGWMSGITFNLESKSGKLKRNEPKGTTMIILKIIAAEIIVALGKKALEKIEEIKEEK